MPSSSSKTVRKGDTAPVPLPDDLKRVLKMPKSKFVEYMVKNSTKKELVQLVMMLQSLETKRQLTPLGDMQVLNHLTKTELSGIIYTRVKKRSCWTTNSISNMVIGILWLGIVTPLSAISQFDATRTRAVLTGADLIINIMLSIYCFMAVSKENTNTRRGNNLRANLFQRHLHRQQQRILNKTHNRAWMQDLRNYFQTSKSTKGSTSQTKKAARK